MTSSLIRVVNLFLDAAVDLNADETTIYDTRIQKKSHTLKLKIFNRPFII